MKKSKKKSKVFKTIKNIGFVIFAITSFILLYFLTGIKSSKLLPNKYFMTILIVLLVITLIYLLILLLSRKRSFGIILFSIFAIILSCGEMYVLSNINYFKKFLKDNLNIEYTVDVYYYVINVNSKYDDIDEMGKRVVYHYDSMDEELLKENINSNLTLKKETDYSTFLNNLLTDKNYVAIMHSSDYDSLIDNDEKYKEKIKIIGKFEVKQAIDKEIIKKDKPDIIKEPFVIYLSGIDTKSGTIPSRSLSDVNMIIVVNPITHKILMVSVPRDYYVQISGTTGLKDKLTHAGILGGIELSLKTVSEYMDVEFDYYARVNFNAVINLVDAVGGININSDVNYSFTCWTDYNCTIYPGDNFVDGKCALAFARERHAYISGDIHRAENQQQVINVLLNKITTFKSFSNYKKILNAISGTFETNLTEDEITSLISYQIGEMPSWKTESIVLDGYGDNLETYSYPNGKLSVMIPNEESVEKAKQRIQEFLEEK